MRGYRGYRFRGLSELYAALILMLASIVIAPMIVRVFAAQGAVREAARPITVFRVNETHALCYTVQGWDTGETRDVLGVDFRFWTYTSDADGDGLLDPVEGSVGETVPPDTYVLVTPPIICTR